MANDFLDVCCRIRRMTLIAMTTPLKAMRISGTQMYPLYCSCSCATDIPANPNSITNIMSAMVMPQNALEWYQGMIAFLKTGLFGEGIFFLQSSALCAIFTFLKILIRTEKKIKL